MGASPMGAPSGNPGQAAQALSMIRQGLEMMQKALPGVPIGSEPHKAVLQAISSISKVVPASAQVPGVQQTGLRDLQQQAQQSQMMHALMRSMGGGSQPGSAAGGGASTAAPAAAA